MYINTELLNSRGLSLHEFGLLCVIRQNKTQDVSEYIEEILTDDIFSRLEQLSLIELTKTGKLKSKRVRTSKKGNTWIEDICQTYLVCEEDITIFNWLKNHYLKLDKEIGSETKCKNLIAWFRRESNISKNNLIQLILAFISDDNRMEYSKVLQYIFWKPENHFQTKPNLSDSKLWLFYEKHREHFDKILTHDI